MNARQLRRAAVDMVQVVALALGATFGGVVGFKLGLLAVGGAL